MGLFFNKMGSHVPIESVLIRNKNLSHYRFKVDFITAESAGEQRKIVLTTSIHALIGSFSLVPKEEQLQDLLWMILSGSLPTDYEYSRLKDTRSRLDIYPIGKLFRLYSGTQAQGYLACGKYIMLLKGLQGYSGEFIATEDELIKIYLAIFERINKPSTEPTKIYESPGSLQQTCLRDRPTGYRV